MAEDWRSYRSRHARGSRDAAPGNRPSVRASFGVLAMAVAATVVSPAMRWPDEAPLAGRVEVESGSSRSGPPTSFFAFTIPSIEPTPEPARPRMIVGDPTSTVVLVNKQFRLPPGWVPVDLVEPRVRFVFSGSDPKRRMRPMAAAALEQLFAAAAHDGVPLAAVSGFRSEERQRTLFEGYAQRDGEIEANRHSARPGHSEHQTGLAMDVTGADGRCPASRCFAGTAAAAWLAAHARDHGFVVRYPAGKETVTGYDAEPWHLRYVGIEMATSVSERGLTLDEAPRSALTEEVPHGDGGG